MGQSGRLFLACIGDVYFSYRGDRIVCDKCGDLSQDLKNLLFSFLMNALQCVRIPVHLQSSTGTLANS